MRRVGSESSNKKCSEYNKSKKDEFKDQSLLLKNKNLPVTADIMIYWAHNLPWFRSKFITQSAMDVSRAPGKHSKASSKPRMDGIWTEALRHWKRTEIRNQEFNNWQPLFITIRNQKAKYNKGTRNMVRSLETKGTQEDWRYMGKL